MGKKKFNSTGTAKIAAEKGSFDRKTKGTVHRPSNRQQNYRRKAA